jgi:hypothetical protein
LLPCLHKTTHCPMHQKLRAGRDAPHASPRACSHPPSSADGFHPSPFYFAKPVRRHRALVVFAPRAPLFPPTGLEVVFLFLVAVARLLQLPSDPPPSISFPEPSPSLCLWL